TPTGRTARDGGRRHEISTGPSPILPRRRSTRPLRYRRWDGGIAPVGGLLRGPSMRRRSDKGHAAGPAPGVGTYHLSGWIAMRIVLMGPPGAGKGTQAGLWCRRHGLTHVTTGSLIRGEIEADTRAGRQAHAAVAAGRLVPDAIVEAMVARRLARRGHRAFLLDGFPRTVEQAAWLTAELARHGAALDAVVCLQVCDAVVVERLSQRRMHPETGEVYHLTLRPPPPSVDPACLLQREDDRPAVIRE